MLYLSREGARQLIEHSKREAPHEACGILAGVHMSNGRKDRKVKRIYQMTNMDKSSRTFFMDPREQLKVMKEIRALGLQMVGIYHSHLETAAYPSEHDVKLAHYPEASYVIVSLQCEDDPTIKSFRIREGEITEEQVNIE